MSCLVYFYKAINDNHMVLFYLMLKAYKGRATS